MLSNLARFKMNFHRGCQRIMASTTASERTSHFRPSKPALECQYRQVTSRTNPNAATTRHTRGIAYSVPPMKAGGAHPPVSNVFHWCPQLQAHWSSLPGDQPQSGQRIRGLEGSPLLSRAGSRSITVEGGRLVSHSRYYEARACELI
jgi:hypothetical protein